MKYIEERGKTFLHLLSLQRQNALLICIIRWSIFFSCTVTCVMQICFCILLLKSVSDVVYWQPALDYLQERASPVVYNRRWAHLFFRLEASNLQQLAQHAVHHHM
jgi:hypothetical protein